jgi:hypothetical protein
MHSTRSSSRVTSRGVPKLVTVEKNRSSSFPLRKTTVSQMSTAAFATGLHELFAFTTVSVKVSGTPLLPSRMSLRTEFVSEA